MNDFPQPTGCTESYSEGTRVSSCQRDSRRLGDRDLLARILSRVGASVERADGVARLVVSETAARPGQCRPVQASAGQPGPAALQFLPGLEPGSFWRF